MMELFKYLELEDEKDKLRARERSYERYLSFVGQCLASPYADQNEREKFRQSLIPKDDVGKPQVKHEWNFELLKKMKARQRKGG